MSQQDIRELLQGLDDALKELSIDEASRAKLDTLVNDLEAQLQSPVAMAETSLPDQVDELVATFESEHPTLAGILNRLMVTLSSMGV